MFELSARQPLWGCSTVADHGESDTAASHYGHRMQSRAVLAVIVLVAALIGANFSMLKFALDHSTPLLVAGMRTVIGGSFLVAFGLLRGERVPRDIPVLKRIFVVSFSITTVSSALLVVGVNKVPAGVASLIASTMPMFTALLAVILLRQALTRGAAAGLLVGLIGTLVLVSPTLSGEIAAVGIIALVFSALAWAFGNVSMKWLDLSEVSPIMLVGTQLWMSAVVLIPFALIVEGTARTEWTIGLFAPLLYAAIPANAVTFGLLALVATRATPTQAAATAYMIPLFGVFFGWLIRDERLGGVEALGGALIVAGVWLLVTSNARATQLAATAAGDSERTAVVPE